MAKLVAIKQKEHYLVLPQWEEELSSFKNCTIYESSFEVSLLVVKNRLTSNTKDRIVSLVNFIGLSLQVRRSVYWNCVIQYLVAIKRL